MASGVYYQLTDYLADVRTLVHDPAAADYTDATLIAFINRAREQVAQDLKCVRQLIAGLNCISGQESYPLSGFVGGVRVDAGGTGYSPTPAVTFGAVTGASGAAASATVVGGVISAINMTAWGQGYGAVPTLAITDVTGTGARATPIVGTNILDLMLVTTVWPGGTLAETFLWLPFDLFQAFCRAYRKGSGWPGAWTGHYGPVNPLSLAQDARRIFVYPIPSEALTMEWDAITLPTTLAAPADIDYWIQRPYTDAVQYYAAHLAYLGMQQFTQAGIMLDLYDKRRSKLPNGTRARRVHNIYRMGMPRLRRM